MSNFDNINNAIQVANTLAPLLRNIELKYDDDEQKIFDVDTTSIPDDIYFKIIVLICYFNNISLDDTNGNFSVRANPNIKESDLPTLLTNSMKGGFGKGDLVEYNTKKTFKISRSSLRNILWFFCTLFTLYFSTQLLLYINMGNVKIQQDIAAIKFDSLETRITQSGPGPRYIEFMQLAELLSKKKSDDEDVLSYNQDSNSRALILLSTVPEVQEMLALPAPDTFESTSQEIIENDKELLKPFTAANLMALFQGTAKALAPQQMQRMEDIKNLMSSKRDELEKMKADISTISSEALEQYQTIKSASNDPVHTGKDIIFNFINFLTLSSKDSTIAKTQESFAVYKAMAEILQDVIVEQLHRIPNVPADISSIMNNYMSIYYSFVSIYIWSGIINGILFGFFGYLINKFIPNPQEISYEEKYQFIQNAIVKLIGQSITIVNDLINSKNVEECKTIFKKYLITQKPTNDDQYNSVVNDYVDIIFDRGIDSDVYKTIKYLKLPKIIGSSPDEEQMKYTNIFSVIITQILDKIRSNTDGQILAIEGPRTRARTGARTGGRKKHTTRKLKQITRKKTARKNKKTRKGGAHCNKKTRKGGAHCNKKTRKGGAHCNKKQKHLHR